MLELDTETLSQIRAIGGEELLGKLARLYLENTPMRLEELRRGMAAGDWERTARAIHSVRSSSVTLGAIELAETAATMEKMAEAGERERLESSLPELLEQTQAALQALGELV